MKDIEIGICLTMEPSADEGDATDGGDEAEAEAEVSAGEADEEKRDAPKPEGDGAVCFSLKSQGKTEVDDDAGEGTGTYLYNTVVKGWSMTPEDWSISTENNTLGNFDQSDIG